MRNKILISGLVFLLIAALIVSASAVDVISVSELFNFGGDTREDAAAEISDAPEDTSAERAPAPAEDETPTSDPVQEPTEDNPADNDTDSADNTATDNPTDGNTDNTTDENAPDGSDDNTEPGGAGEEQTAESGGAVTDATGEMDSVDVPAQGEIINEINTSETQKIYMTCDTVAVTGGVEHITTDIPPDLQAEMADYTGILVEIPVYLSGVSGENEQLPFITNGSLEFSPSFLDEHNNPVGDAFIIALSPKIGEAFAGFTTASTRWNTFTTVTVTNKNGVQISAEGMPFITLRYCVSPDLVSGELRVRFNAKAAIPGQGNSYFYYYTSMEAGADTWAIYDIVPLVVEGGALKGVAYTHEHVVDSWTVTTAPTCTTPGIETGTCTSTHCPNHSADNALTRDVPALGHTISDQKAYRAPTCTEDGTYAYAYCSTCKKYLNPEAENLQYTTDILKNPENADEDMTSASAVITKLGHQFETVDYLPPTCAAVGHVEHQICTRPGCPEGLTFNMSGVQYETGGEIIPIDPANHVNALGEITYIEPNCLAGSAGRNQYWHCADCNKYFTDAEGTPENETTVAAQVIPNDHLFETVPAVEQDCHIQEETGTGIDAVAEHQVCTRDCCEGLVYDMEGQATTMEALTTPFTHTKPANPAEIETVAATWNADGYIRYVCVECGETITEIIPASGNAPATSGRYAPNTDDSSSNPVLWVMFIFLGMSLAGLTVVTLGRRKYNH